MDFRFSSPLRFNFRFTFRFSFRTELGSIVDQVLNIIKFQTIGVKPLRFTPEWVECAKERERQENNNPVTRYLDRRALERGPRLNLSYWCPTDNYFPWMWTTHDHDVREEKGYPDLRA